MSNRDDARDGDGHNDASRARHGLQVHPHYDGLQRQLRREQIEQPGSASGRETDRSMSESHPPKSVRVAVIGIFVLAASHLAVLALLALHNPDVMFNVDNMLSAWLPNAPSISEIDSYRPVVLVSASIGSLVMALLLIWLGLKTRGGRHWARVAVTVVVALGLPTALLDLLNSSSQSVFTLVEVLLRVGVLALLWSPQDSRLYFGRPADEEATL